jgi:hypothetical protein
MALAGVVIQVNTVRRSVFLRDSQYFDCDLFAEFSVNSLQGSLIAAKAQRSPEPVNRFKKILFSVILH